MATTFNVDGHEIEISKTRDSETYTIDGQVYSHSGRIRLQRSEMFHSRQDQGGDLGLYIVQYESKIFPSYHDELTDLGVEIIKYVPDHALLVQTNPSLLEQIAERVHVRSVSRYDGAYKMAGVPRSLWLQPEAFSQARYDIVAINENHKAKVLQVAQKQGLPVVHTGEDSFAVTVFASLEQLEPLALSPFVLWIELAPTGIEEDMDIVHIQGGVQTLTQNTGGYKGQGIRGHVLEGIYRDHKDFEKTDFRDAPIAIGDDSANGHGQKTYGIIYGSGAGDISALGMMPMAQGFYTDSRFVFNKDSRYALTQELIEDHQVMLQTASWGYPTTTEYTARSLEMDKIIFELDLIVTQSQSNRGNRDSRPQAWAKNIISVGAVHHGNNTSFADDSWSKGNASIGPASDGRIKPDIVSYYDNIHTTSSVGYGKFGGTSAATPIVNGHVGLIIEMFTDGIFGNTLQHPVTERFLNRPRAATAKALLINSARQYNFKGKKADMARVHQGWGHPNLQGLYERRDQIFIVDETQPLKTLESQVYSFEVAEGQTKLATTLVYSDPDGVVGAEIHRVNDLDLVVIDPDGVRYQGNHGLMMGPQSLPGGAPDTINTVENVFIENPKAGRWQFAVMASEVNQEGHLRTPEIDAAFALVINGIQRP